MVSVTIAPYSWFQLPGVKVRGISYPQHRFVVSVTEIEISVTKIRGISYPLVLLPILNQCVMSIYPLLNTFITQINTPKPPAKNGTASP